MKSPHRTRWLSCLSALSIACSAAPDAKPPSAPLAHPEAKSAGAEESPLFRALSGVPSEAVLDALTPKQRDKLREFTDALTAEQRELLLGATDPAAAARPLLHLSAGGQELDLVKLLFTSNLGSKELLLLALDAGDADTALEVALTLAKRAAQHVLRARAADVSASVEHKAEHLEEIALAARFLERTDIERLAIEELLRDHASPDWELAMARLSARELDVPRAEAHLAKAVGVDPARRDAVVQQVNAARVAQGPASSLDQRLAKATALLTLGDAARALVELEAESAQADAHLGLATTLVRARAGGGACPGLPASIALEQLCQSAWSALLAGGSEQLLRSAWQSGQGRSAASVEAYIGLAHVVPLMYGLTEQGAPASAESVRAAFSEIRTVANDAGALAPAFSAIEALARAMELAVEAAAQTSRHTLLPSAAREELHDTARVMSRREDTWGQAAALGIAGMLSREADAREVVDNLKGRVAREYETTLGSLLLWDALADGDPARFEEHKGMLAEIATNKDADSFERSKWLFAWAEAEAHLAPSPRSYDTLRSIADKLVDPRVPLELRLRASLDLAGLDARSAKLDAAIGRLEQIVTDTPRSSVASHNEQELLIAATGYLLVLRALSTEAEERRDYVQKLEALLLDVTRSGAAPPTLEMWLVLWRAEFDGMFARQACKGNAACERRVEPTRRLPPGKLEEAIGQRSAQLLQRGVVPVGGVQIEFRFDARARLVPVIEIAPQFLMIHAPKL